jgi:hypothetical protein
MVVWLNGYSSYIKKLLAELGSRRFAKYAINGTCRRCKPPMLTNNKYTIGQYNN